MSLLFLLVKSPCFASFDPPTIRLHLSCPQRTSRQTQSEPIGRASRTTDSGKSPTSLPPSDPHAFAYPPDSKPVDLIPFPLSHPLAWASLPDRSPSNRR